MSQDFFDDENSAHLFQLVHMQRSAMMHMGGKIVRGESTII